jgi:hypothetical protein
MTWSEHRRHVRTESGLGSDALNDTLETLNRKTHTFNRTQRMSFLRAAPLTESDLKKMCPYVVSPVGALGATEKLVADSLAGGWDAHDIGKAPFGNSKAPLGYYQAVKIIEKILHDLGVEEEHQAGAMALVYDIRTRRFPESLPKLEIPAL